MKYLHIFDASGCLRIRQELMPEDDAQEIAERNNAHEFIVSDEMYDSDSVYLKDKVIVSKGARPSKFHVFDYAEQTWKDSRTADQAWASVRAERDALLAATDWTDTFSAPVRLGSAYDTWQTYRQALRDITLQTDPFNIVWPTKPI